MLTLLVAITGLGDAPPYWELHHRVIVIATGIFLDVLLVVAVAATLAAGAWASGRADGLARLKRLARVLAGVDRVVIALGCMFLALLVLVTFVSVVGRNVWAPIPDDITFAEWAMVALVMVMLGTTQGRGEHIEVTALADALPERVNRLLRLLGALMGLAFVGHFAAVNYPEVAEAFLEETYGSIYALPLWPPRWVFFLGLAAWLVRLYAQAVVLLADAVRPLPRTGGGTIDLTPLLPADSGSAQDTKDVQGTAGGKRDGPLLPREGIGDGA